MFRPKGTCPQQDWTQEVKLLFLAPSLLPRSHFQHLIVRKAYSSPLFYLFLIRSCTQEGKVTNSILQVEKLRHRKEKKKLRSWGKRKKFPDESIFHHSLLCPILHPAPPPTPLASCTCLPGTVYSGRRRRAETSGQSTPQLGAQQ